MTGPVLPHHPACGSAPGGSEQYVPYPLRLMSPMAAKLELGRAVETPDIPAIRQ